MPLIYNGQKIIPAPLVTINKEYQKSGDGQKIGTLFSLTLRGTILPGRGSPNSSGEFWTNSGYPSDETIDADERLKAIERKQEAIRKLFSEEGHAFEIQPLDGTAPIKCYPRILSINFAEGVWYEKCDYTIEIEADDLVGVLNATNEDEFNDYIQEAAESWTLEFADSPESDAQQTTFRLTHNVSAVGKRHYDSTGTTVDAWIRARSWVQPRLGLDTSRLTASGSLNLPSYMGGFNHVRSETVDERGGSYNVSETWLISSGNALEDFTITSQTSTEDGLNRVSIAGNIVGLETRNPTTFEITQTKWEAALAKFNLVENIVHSRAELYSGYTLNTNTLASQITKNPVLGTIGYSYEFNNRPINVIPNSISEVITISYELPIDIFASIPVLGRRKGPVLQDLAMSGSAVRSLSIEAVMPPVTGISYAEWEAGKPDVSAILEDVRPKTNQVFISANQENWTPINGRYSRNISWTFE